MTVTVHDFPVKRPGFITTAEWIGDDDDLSLQLTFPTETGTSSFSLDTRNAERGGEICLPGSSDVAELSGDPDIVRDLLTAHIRMAVLVKGHAAPGSHEFEDAVLDHVESNHLQTAIGTVKVKSVTIVDDLCVDLEFQKGSGPKRTYRMDYTELMNYSFVPSTQLWVVAGAIEKAFPNAVHDHPTEVLTSTEKQDIVDYVEALELWL